ncbi:hypothetical protein BGW42_001831 [Actinomortierella wolfii]|nr:hypothetical protein BGW42_001831 [Actinomortierella wolfii]
MAYSDRTATAEEQQPILAGKKNQQSSSLVANNNINNTSSTVAHSDDSYRTLVPSSSTTPSPALQSGSARSSLSADDSSDSSSSEDDSDMLPKPNSTGARRNSSTARACNVLRLRQVAFVIAQLGLLLFFGTLTAVIIKAPWVYPYTWHPIFMSLFGLLATEAILVLQPKELARHKRNLKTVHAVLHGSTFLFLIVGYVAIWVNKSIQHKVHFKSYHAWVGTATLVAVFGQLIFGVLVGYFPRMLRRYGQPRMMRLHRVLGYVSIALLWITLWLGTITNWMNRNFDKPWIMNLATTMVAIGLVAGITPDRLFKRSGYRSIATYATKNENGVEHLEALLKDVSSAPAATKSATTTTTTATTSAASGRAASNPQQEGVDMIMETLNRVTDRVAAAGARSSSASSSSAAAASSFFGGAKHLTRIPQRHLTSHNLHIHASMNNTILTLTDSAGVPIVNTSAGMAGLKKSQRAGPEAGYQAMLKMIEKVQEKNVHIASLHVLLKGFGPGRDAAFKAITTKTSWDIKRISDTTPIPFNGCRPPKPRRL